MFKKYRLKCQYCGSDEYKWEWLLKLQLIFTNNIYYSYHNYKYKQKLIGKELLDI